MDDSISISCFYIAASALGHFEANPVFWLATWEGKLGRRTRSGLHGLILRKKENCSERTYRGVRKLWTVSATESQKAVEDGQSKENSWVYWATKAVGSLSHLLK